MYATDTKSETKKHWQSAPRQKWAIHSSSIHSSIHQSLIHPSIQSFKGIFYWVSTSCKLYSGSRRLMNKTRNLGLTVTKIEKIKQSQVDIFRRKTSFTCPTFWYWLFPASLVSEEVGCRHHTNLPSQELEQGHCPYPRVAPQAGTATEGNDDTFREVGEQGVQG